MTEPSPFLLWLATGQRRSSLRALRLAAGVLLLLLLLGPSAIVAPTVAAARSSKAPPPLAGSGVNLVPVSATQAEQQLGAPLLDGPALHGSTQLLGIWSAVLDGPYGHTAIIFQTYSTSRRTWLTVLQVRSERPMADSPWQLILAQSVTVDGHTAHLYSRPGSDTVTWQETPTLEASFSEDSQQVASDRSLANGFVSGMLDQEHFLQAAAALQPRGRQVGPFRLDLPW